MVTVYAFASRDECLDSYTTTDPVEARQRAEQYGLRVIAHEFEWADSELVWDFTGKEESESDA